MSKFIGVVAGAAEIVAGALLSPTPLAPISPWLITTGAGSLIGGAGTLLAGSGRGKLGSLATTMRNPVAPWKGVYGRARVGGTLACHTFESEKK